MEITPRFSDTFRAFKECPWHRLHTVLLGQDPYPGRIDRNTYVADGLAFSSKASRICPKSLSRMYSALNSDIYGKCGYPYQENYDLTRWANQGILLLNVALSYPIGSKSGAHANIWHPFISYVLNVINKRKDCIAFGLFGSYAKAYKPLLTNHTFAVYDCEHPAACEHRLKGQWDHDGVFKAIDGFHQSINNIKITW